MKNYEELAIKMSDMKNLKQAIDKFKSAKSDDTLEEFGIGFNLDDRFSAVKIELSLDTWSKKRHSFSLTILDMNDRQKIKFRDHFTTVLNNNLNKLLSEVVELMRTDAMQYKNIAVEEMNEFVRNLRELEE